MGRVSYDWRTWAVIVRFADLGYEWPCWEVLYTSYVYGHFAVFRQRNALNLNDVHPERGPLSGKRCEGPV